MKCKFCGKSIEKNDFGYLVELDDSELTRMKQLKLNKDEMLCTECKKEIMFAGLAVVL